MLERIAFNEKLIHQVVDREVSRRLLGDFICDEQGPKGLLLDATFITPSVERSGWRVTY